MIQSVRCIINRLSERIGPMKFQNILFPTDFSDLSRSCEGYVRKMMEHFGSRLHVFHAVEVPATFYGVPGEYFGETIDARKLQDFAENTLRGIYPDLSVQRIVRIGDPARLIAEYVEENNIDLVMIPTHGYGPFRRALIGSTTAKVLHDVECAVWTIAHEPKPFESKLCCQRIVCDIDIVPESVNLIRKAADFAESFEAKVWLAHTVAKVHTMGDEFGLGGTHSEWAINLQNYYVDFAVREIAKLQQEAGTHFEVSIEPGVISTAAAQIARARDADLVIIGRSSHGWFSGFRSHAYPIVHESPCPVLSL